MGGSGGGGDGGAYGGQGDSFGQGGSGLAGLGYSEGTGFSDYGAAGSDPSGNPGGDGGGNAMGLAMGILGSLLGFPVGTALSAVYGLTGSQWGKSGGGMDPGGNLGGWGEGGGQPNMGGIPGAQPAAQTSPSSYGPDFASMAQGLVGAKDPSGGYKRLGADVMKDDGYLSMIRNLAQQI